MHRAGEDHVRPGALDDPAGIHDGDLVRLFRHHPQIVRDEQQGHAEPLLQLLDEAQDLRLDGNIQRRRRFVRHEQRRVAAQRHRDHHPLALAAAQLMRKVVHPVFRLGDPDQFQHFHRAVAGVVLAHPLVQAHRLGDLVAHGEDRIERGHRLLEDHGDLVAADLAHLFLVELGEVPPLVTDLAADDAPRALLEELHHRQRGDALAAARFADQAHGLAFRDGERDAVDGTDFAVGCEKRRLEVVDLQQDTHGSNLACLPHGRRVARAAAGLIFFTPAALRGDPPLSHKMRRGRTLTVTRKAEPPAGAADSQTRLRYAPRCPIVHPWPDPCTACSTAR